MNCDYGCGDEARYLLSNGKQCCTKHYNQCPAIRAKNSAGVKKAYAEDRKGYTYNPNSAWSKGKSITPTKKILCANSAYSNEYTKSRIIKENLLEQKCHNCGIAEWLGKPITLELEHKNGDNRDHRIENLEFLCPNCHSQTDTWRGRNINTGSIKVLDKDIISAYTETGNIRQTLMAVGLAAKGGNYKRVKRILKNAGVAEVADAADGTE